MRRRELLALGSAAALARPAVLRAQAAKPVIGFLHSGAPDENAERMAAFLKGLSDAGFIEGQNVSLEYRWAMGKNDKLPALAAELVQRQVALIVTVASAVATRAAKDATSTIPIVFSTGGDPIDLGFVASLAHPGGNITGVTSLNVELASKRLGLFRELVPTATYYFALVNPTSPLTAPFTKDLASGSSALGLHFEILHASNDTEIETAFATVARQPGAVMVFAPDAFFYIRRTQIVALATKDAIPTLFDVPEYIETGGLMSYGSDFSDVLQISGNYAARILKGEKPANLPVAQSTKFTMAINLKTAKALGLTVSPLLLAQTDNLVE
jgi:putative tryptophan/tyrosine transport system substrate-binding protein